MVDDNYVLSLTAAIKGQIRESELNAIKANHDAQVAKAEAPKRWAELKSWLKEAIAKVSAELSPDTLQYQEETPNKLSLQCQGGRRTQVNVSFVEINGGIALHGNGFNAEFEPVIEGDELSYVLSDSRTHTRRKIEIDAMGKHILNAVAGYRQ